jgi:pyridoxamine 5'-phosphate oxidase
MSDPLTRDFTEAADPLALFRAWMAEAAAAEPVDPDAMALATVDASGLPNVRMILLKGADESGFVFYTNCESAKGGELAVNAKAALLFYWKSLGRQIRVRGPVESASAAEADAYFATRHRESQIGACASRQSRPLASRAALEAEVARLTHDFKEARFGALIIGAATGLCRSRSSSGKRVRSACMTGSCSAEPPRTNPGPRLGSTLRTELGAIDHKPAMRSR